MKAYRRPLSPRAYTLIELLMVIGIIAILAGLAVPVIVGAMRRAKIVKTQTALKDIVLGQNEQKSREVRYIERSIGRGGAGGLTGTEGNYALIDLWGTPYQVIVDANSDDKIANPDVKNADPTLSSGAPPFLFVGAAALSFGEDKKPNTKDDVVSWR